MATPQDEDLFSTKGGTATLGSTVIGMWQYLTRRPAKDTGFHSASTAEEVSSGWDGRGKVVVITGASTGLGLESARVLAARGAEVIMGVRDMDKAKRNAEAITQRNPQAKLLLLPLDLASLASVKAFAKQVKALSKPLHVLVLNAGIASAPFQTSADGYESHFAINHLGHFLLTQLLLDSLLSTAREQGAPEGRLVVVSSEAHQFWPGSDLQLDKLQSAEGYRPWTPYGRSKLCNILFARELHERLQGQPVAVVSCHPGTIKTEIVRHWPSGLTTQLILGIAGPLMKSVPQGAATQVYLSTAPRVEGGEYYADSQPVASTPAAHSRRLAQQLWKLSEEACQPFLSG